MGVGKKGGSTPRCEVRFLHLKNCFELVSSINLLVISVLG